MAQVGSDKASRDRRRLIPAAALLAALMIAAIRMMWTAHPPDLSALYMAGYLFAEGRFDLIYAAPDGFFGATPPDWMPVLGEIGLYGQEVLPFVYPPLWAALLSPIAGAVDPATFFRAADIALVCLLAGSVLVAWRMARHWAMPLWAWILVATAALATSTMSFMAMMQLQPHILVVFLTLLAFERYGAGRSLAAGVCLGLAAALKLSPAALILIFVLDRDGRALAGFAAMAGLCALASLALAGPDLHRAFLDSMAQAVSGTQITGVTFSADVLLNGAASALGLAAPLDLAQHNIRIPHTPMPARLAGKLAMLAALIWMLRATAGLDRQKRIVARLFLLSLLVGLFGPLGWAFYFLPQILLVPALVGLLPRREGAAVMIAALALTSWPLFTLIGMHVAGDYPRAALGAVVLLAMFGVVTAKLGRQGARLSAPAGGPDASMPARGLAAFPQRAASPRPLSSPNG